MHCSLARLKTGNAVMGKSGKAGIVYEYLPNTFFEVSHPSFVLTFF